MSDIDYLNFSTDLRRIAIWLMDGDEVLAKRFIEKNRDKFGQDKCEIGKKKISTWLARVADFAARGEKSAEDALTLSVLLKNRFGG